MKGQVALEFLTTYGWALLVIGVMIGAISYFGILDPSTLTPSSCTTGAELRCMDYTITDGHAKVLFRQTVGKTIYIQEVSCQYEGSVVIGTASISGSEIAMGSQWSPRNTVEVNCDLNGPKIELLKGEKIRVPFELIFSQNQEGFNHTVQGVIFTEVQ